jgi:hypothetical protein
MAIKFKNTRTNEIVVCDSEPKISAFWNSSNMGPNAMGGQDFGWKLAEEVVVELRRIKRNPSVLQGIANNMGKALNEISDTDILKYISDHTDVDDAPIAMEDDFEEEYNANVRRLERETRDKVDPRMEDARIEAEDLGLDVSKYSSYALLRSAIVRAQSKQLTK